MKINKDIFDLASDQIDTSKVMYNGKIIKCLVAPYHSYTQLEKLIPFTKSTYLFPERDLNNNQLRGFISLVVSSNTTEEVRIITTNMNIIQDMVDSSVRVLTEGGDVVNCPCKTLYANIHDIRYLILENESHQLSKVTRGEAHNKIQDIITEVNDKKNGITSKERSELSKRISMIGEPIIEIKLSEMLSDIKTIK